MKMREKNRGRKKVISSVKDVSRGKKKREWGEKRNGRMVIMLKQGGGRGIIWERRGIKA